MEALFDVKHATLSEHITNILASGELDDTSVGFSDKFKYPKRQRTDALRKQMKPFYLSPLAPNYSCPLSYSF